jgi:non-heme chloroperoxidase
VRKSRIPQRRKSLTISARTKNDLYLARTNITERLPASLDVALSHFPRVVLTLLWEWAWNVFAIPQLDKRVATGSEQNDNNREEHPNAIAQIWRPSSRYTQHVGGPPSIGAHEMKPSKALGTLGKVAPVMMLFLALGASCPTQAIARHMPPRCISTPPYDTVPFKAEKFVTVAPGVNLEVLDWGGSGEMMVLLTGSGDNAHVFDYFAFQFTDFFHVIGITRRGWLPSSQPDNGYDVETRAADDIKLLDALHITKAIFVGHSIAGSELSKIGATYPNYVDKLVYLDAVDLSERNTFPDIPSPFSLFTDAANRSIFDLQAAYARLLAVREPAPAICLSFAFDQDGTVTDTSTPASIQEQLSAGVNLPNIPPTNWADIKVPRLGIFAPFTVESKLPFYWYLGPADQAIFDERFPRLIQWQTDVIAKFAEQHAGSPTPKVTLLPGAPHYIYINNEAEVVREMRSFLGVPSTGN